MGTCSDPSYVPPWLQKLGTLLRQGLHSPSTSLLVDMALSTAGVRFPAPIGGIPMDRDFAPSILFACLYGVLTFLGFYRMAKRDSRSLFVATSLAFTIERYDTI